jgi:transposase
VPVDEYNTTQKCAHCHGQTMIVEEEAERDGASAAARHELRGLKLCSSCVRFLRRDVNAAQNMLCIYSEWSNGRARPAAFARGLPAQRKHHILLADAEMLIASTRSRLSSSSGP